MKEGVLFACVTTHRPKNDKGPAHRELTEKNKLILDSVSPRQSVLWRLNRMYWKEHTIDWSLNLGGPLSQVTLKTRELKAHVHLPHKSHHSEVSETAVPTAWGRKLALGVGKERVLWLDFIDWSLFPQKETFDLLTFVTPGSTESAAVASPGLSPKNWSSEGPLWVDNVLLSKRDGIASSQGNGPGPLSFREVTEPQPNHKNQLLK